jgi:hypothetical protein
MGQFFWEIIKCRVFQLSGVTIREMTMPTTLVLCEHIEKTAAMISLRQIHSE